MHSVEAELKGIVQLIQDEDFSAALDRANDVIAVNGQHPEAHVLRAISLASLGRERDAGQAFRRALALAPLNSKALYNYALLQFEQGDLAGAETTLDTLLLNHPEHVSGKDLRAELRATRRDATPETPSVMPEGHDTSPCEHGEEGEPTEHPGESPAQAETEAGEETPSVSLQLTPPPPATLHVEEQPAEEAAPEVPEEPGAAPEDLSIPIYIPQPKVVENTLNDRLAYGLPAETTNASGYVRPYGRDDQERLPFVNNWQPWWDYFAWLLSIASATKLGFAVVNFVHLLSDAGGKINLDQLLQLFLGGPGRIASIVHLVILLCSLVWMTIEVINHRKRGVWLIATAIAGLFGIVWMVLPSYLTTERNKD